MKLPASITRRFRRNPAPPRRAVQTTLKATAAARRGELDDYDSPEPTTSLSAAFIIVFLLHVVAVIGIYIFNHIKSTRPATPVGISASGKTKAAATKPATQKSAAPESASKPAPVAQTNREPALPKLLPSGARIHRVQSGENLTKIATTYAIRLADLEEANKLPQGATIKVDQVLNIPAIVVRQPAPPAPKSEPAVKTVPQPIALKSAPPKPAPTKPAAPKVEPKIYTVDKGDTVTYIAKRFGVSGADLIKLNGISDPKKLQPGRKLRIPVKS